MVVSQGDVFWAFMDEPRGSEPGGLHPVVVVQSDRFNRGNLNTVVVCALTSNLRRSRALGNVLLAKGEANLPKRSVVNVTQLGAIDKSELIEKIGTVSARRLADILDGVYLLLEPIDDE